MTDQVVDDVSGPDELVSSIVDVAFRLEFDDLDSAVVDAARHLLLDFIGVLIAGADGDAAREVVEMSQTMGGSPEATIVGQPKRLPALSAAMIHGTMGRVWDFDDVFEPGMSHGTVNIFPQALAAAESSDVRVCGKEFITSFVLGMEVANRIALAVTNSRSPDAGKRLMSTNIPGAFFGGTVAASRLLKLTRLEMLNAVGLAFSMVTGSQQPFFEGSLAARVQQGFASSSSLRAVLLAKRGVTGPRRPFEGSAGYFNLFWQGAYDRATILMNLGHEFSMPNVSVKPYPCCKLSHNAVAAALTVRHDYDLDAQLIDHVEVYVESQDCWDMVCAPVEAKQSPSNSVEAQFSLPYAVAAALYRGEVRLESFAAGSWLEDGVLNLAHRVRPILRTSVRSKPPSPATVRVMLRDGSELVSTCRYPSGSPSNPMPWSDVVSKFMSNVSYPEHSMPAMKAHSVVNSLAQFERVEDVGLWAREALVW